MFTLFLTIVLIATVITCILAVGLSVVGDGYGRRPERSDYDTRAPQL
ncbi:hypothetical protein GCM10009808_14720 [Microbacterium sediminicola]|uniref:Uncharacterized protein n=1 Tax=Microbacterium sediminicola TaxID=415210 RepID=A0ABP4U4B1_9MICO